MPVKHVAYPLITLLVFALATPVCAQERSGSPLQRCGTNDYYNRLFQKKPELRPLFLKAQRRINGSVPVLSNGQPLRIKALNDTIPVVVHVVGTAEIQAQVTDAIIRSQIDVLNEDFKGLNADSVRIPAAFKPLFGKGTLTFQLAGTNPLGEPTSGITRRLSLATFNSDNVDYAKTYNTGGDDAWDAALYLNIWVVSFGSTGLLGISVFPGDPQPINLHGFVCDYRAFGRGASYLFPNYNRGRTTTHELGHFFNLIHTWGDDGGACTGSDFDGSPPGLDDTPNQADQTLGNPDPPGTGTVVTDGCSPAAPGIMYQNYMDYTDDVAMALFTNGQQTRMENALQNSPDRSALLESNTYLPAPVYARDARVRIVNSPSAAKVYCSTNVTPQLVLRNSGSTALSTVTITSILNNGTPVVFNWSGPALAPYTEVGVTLPAITGITGPNSLTVYTSNPNSSTDLNTANDTVTVNFSISSPVALPVTEDFVATQFPPPNWSVFNPDGSITWQRAGVGFGNPGSAYKNTFSYEAFNEPDELYTPLLLYPPADSLILSFDLSAATYTEPNTTTIPLDTLEILVTQDCGNTFTSVYKKWGVALQTLHDPINGRITEFFPDSDSQWRSEYVDLSPWVKDGSVQLVFRNTSNYENNIFVDNVRVYTKALPQALKDKGYLLLPNPFAEKVYFWFLAQPTGLKYINVYNTAGARVWSRAYPGAGPTYNEIDLTGLPAGVYFIEAGFRDTKKNISTRVVKQ